MGLTEETSYLYLRWNAQTRTYEKDPQEPLAHSKVVEIVDFLIQLTAFPDVIWQFHPMRKMTESLESEVIPFTLSVQNRSQESQQFYFLMGRLCRNGCLHLIGATMRPKKLGRSPLAIRIDQLLQSA